jgi:hypothetical protein
MRREGAGGKAHRFFVTLPSGSAATTLGCPLARIPDGVRSFDMLKLRRLPRNVRGTTDGVE